jgi:hypothetical protein
MSSYEILKYDDCKIELIKLFKCENKKELEMEETRLIKEHHNNILMLFSKLQEKYPVKKNKTV